MEVEFTIMDATGSVLHTETIYGRAGMNHHRLSLPEIQSGMMYYQLKTREWSGVKKMVQF
jgi:hypothetical protein